MKKLSSLVIGLVLLVAGCTVKEQETIVLQKEETVSSSEIQVVDASGITEGEALDVSIIATFEPLAENEVLAWEQIHNEYATLRLYAQNHKTNTAQLLVEFDEKVFSASVAHSDSALEDVVFGTLSVSQNRKKAVISGYKTNCFYYIDGEKGEVQKIPYREESFNNFRVPALSDDGRYIAYHFEEINTYLCIMYDVEKAIVYKKIYSSDWITNFFDFAPSFTRPVYTGIVRCFFKDNALQLIYGEEVRENETEYFRVQSAAELDLSTGELRQLFDETIVQPKTLEEAREKTFHGLFGDDKWLPEDRNRRERAGLHYNKSTH